ncbi:MAG: aspartate-semialdehyde dehydrogenase [Cyanobacteria bacterium RYN_339]|nr:aspartate-semialdehyde dehydrogenase [Cyanobacteria bacterium RYN_339]
MYNVAILGATGVVGQEMLKTLIARKFPVKELKLLASSRSAGTSVTFDGKTYPIEEATPEAFAGIDIVLASAGASVSEKLAPHAVAAGAIVIDNTSFFRMHPDVPLVVPEVNAHHLDQHKGIIANPNCSTAPLVMVLNELRKLAPLRRVVVSTYQSVSGAGKEAMEELREQTRAALNGETHKPEHIVHPIAFNLVPAIDSFLDNGYTKEEMKVTNESRKILDEPDLAVTATAVRVPVYICHSEAVNIEFDRPVSVADARAQLANAEGIELMDDPANNVYPRPMECAGSDPTYVGRLRGDVSHPNGLNLWLVSDNLRKGAALNAIQIAEALVARGLLKARQEVAL